MKVNILINTVSIFRDTSEVLDQGSNGRFADFDYAALTTVAIELTLCFQLANSQRDCCFAALAR